MEQKIIKMPFDIELAKKITEKSVKGRIVTRDGRNARIACWNYKSLSGEYPLLVLIENGIFEAQELYTLNGKEKSFIKEACDSDLVLEIPEYMTFKVGDVVFIEGDMTIDGYIYCGIGILDNISIKNNINVNFHANVLFERLDKSQDLYFGKGYNGFANIRLATESEKQRLIEALKVSTNPKAKACLEMLGIETLQNSPKLSNSLKIGKKEGKLREAVHEHYQCNGKYPCSERAYCRFCEGKNIAHDCDEDCCADEFSEGFLAGWDACMKNLAELPWDEAMNEIKNCKKR